MLNNCKKVETVVFFCFYLFLCLKQEKPISGGFGKIEKMTIFPRIQGEGQDLEI